MLADRTGFAATRRKKRRRHRTRHFLPQHRRQKSGGERGIRTLDTGFPVYSLSRRAPSTYSAISPQLSFHQNQTSLIACDFPKIKPKETVAWIMPVFNLAAISYLLLFRSIKISLATAFSVSKTPSPVVAQASKSGTLVVFSSRRISSTVITLGRSRLLY